MASAHVDPLNGRVNFGFLTVIGEGERYHFPSGKGSYRRFICRCECGAERLFSASQLTSGKRLSCGCRTSWPLIGAPAPHRPSDLLALPKSNKEAAALGLKYYYTGMACPKGHISFRWVSNQWCATCAHEAGKEYGKRNPVRLWAHSCIKSARDKSLKQGLPFDITIKYIMSIRTERCPALGVDLDYSFGKGMLKDDSPTLDRTIPAEGYVQGNVVVISHLANRIKNSATADQIQMVADWLMHLNGRLL